jgi:iron(III) transport system substrate-binding protein
MRSSPIRKYEGMVCTRSSSNIYMLSLMAAMIAHHGEDAAQDWAAGLKDNRARDPQGGDTDQLRGIVSGECAIAVSNTYYFARALRKDVDGLSEAHRQASAGCSRTRTERAPMSTSPSAAWLANAPNRDNAVKFLEYLASDAAQEYFSAGNDEYPAVPGVGLGESVARARLVPPGRSQPRGAGREPDRGGAHLRQRRLRVNAAPDSVRGLFVSRRRS